MSGYWKIIAKKLAQNLCTNPSFEIDTTGWTLGSAHYTANRAIGDQFRGAYAINCYTVAGTSGSPENVMNFAITFSSAGIYTITCYLKVKDTFAFNDYVYLGQQGFAGATWQEIVRADDDNSIVGRMIRLEGRLTVDAGDLAGNIVVFANTTADFTFVIDAVQIESGSVATTYFDGDERDSYWTSTDHDSISVRPDTTRRGGYEYDLDTQYSIQVEMAKGIGAPLSKINLDAAATAETAQIQSRKIMPRTFDLILNLNGSSRQNLHLLRKNFWEAIRPWPSKKNEQPVILRYTGANPYKSMEIEAYYDSGMEFDIRNINERIQLRLLAPDPYWRELRESLATLLESQSLTLYYMAGLVQGKWGNLSASSFNGAINAIAVDHINGYLYVGGAFTAPYNRIARQKLGTSSWDQLGTGANGTVHALQVDANGDLIVGGAFTTLNGVTVNGIGKWTGTTFTAYGTGVAGGSATVYNVLIAGNGYIYIAGNFDSADGDGNCNGLAYWDGSDFKPLLTGTASTCWALAEDYLGIIYIGGEFTNLGDANGDYITSWNGSTFVSLSTGLNNICRALDYGEDGNLYVGGDFTIAGGVTASRIAMWSGGGFSGVGNGVNSGVYALRFHDGDIYVGGAFSGILPTGRPAVGFAIWNGTVFEPMPIIPPGTPIIKAIDISKWGDIYIGFDTTGSATTSEQADAVIEGTEITYPRLVMRNEHGSQVTNLKYLENFTTEVKIWFNYSIKPGETIIFDFHPLRKSVKSSLYGNLPHIVDEGSDTDFYLLDGTNRINCLAYGGTPVGNLIYRPTHALADGVAE